MSNEIFLLIWTVDSFGSLNKWFYNTTSDEFPNEAWKYWLDEEVKYQLAEIVPEDQKVILVESISGQLPTN
jgi:hypothetical protein